MGEALLVLAVVLGVLLLGALAVLLTVVSAARSLQRRNRVSPPVATQAPTLWLWSVHHAARSHRRLQRVALASRAARAAAGTAGLTVSDIAMDLERQACALDDQVVLAARLPGLDRYRRLYDLDRSVRELELLAVRVTTLAGQFGSYGAVDVASLTQRLATMESAVAEVQRLDREARGEVHDLVSSTAALAPASPPWLALPPQPAQPAQAPQAAQTPQPAQATQPVDGDAHSGPRPARS